jgi:hypothetical protein
MRVQSVGSTLAAMVNSVLLFVADNSMTRTNQFDSLLAAELSVSQIHKVNMQKAKPNYFRCVAR